VCKCVLPPGDNPIAVNKYITLLLKQNGKKILIPKNVGAQNK
jgi:hypothetical protein